MFILLAIFSSLSNCLLRKYIINENANKIIDKDKKISDITVYLFSADDINIKKAEMLIKIIAIIRTILDKILVFSLYFEIDFLFSFSSNISILSQPKHA